MAKALRVSIWLAIICFTSVVVYFFRTPYPLSNPRSALSGHLSADFGFPLPALARISHAQAVVARAPEQVYELDMTSADLAAMLARIRTESARRNYTINECKAYIHPYYITPAWWTAKSDSLRVIYVLNVKGGLIWDYGLMFDEASGRVWLFWGGF